MAKMFLECVFMKALCRWYPDRESNKAYLIKSVKMPQKDKFAKAPIYQGVVN